MDDELPEGFTGNETPEHDHFGDKAWAYAESDDEICVCFSSAYNSEVYRFMRKHDSQVQAGPAMQPNPPSTGEKPLSLQCRENIGDIPAHITPKTLRFNNQVHIREENNDQVRKRLGLKCSECIPEAYTKYQQKLLDAEERYYNEPDPDQKEELRLQLRVITEARVKTWTDAEPIPEGIERELVLYSNNYRDGKWTRHVLNNSIKL